MTATAIPHNPRMLISAVMLVGLLSWATFTTAQTNPGSGRKLDNSLQVGSGGVNQPQAQPDYRARNDLVTGNVGGMGYFHGNVGYRAPGDFAGSTADAALFRFRAQSLSNTSTVPGGLSRSPYPTFPGQPGATLYNSFAPSSPNNLLSPGPTNTLTGRGSGLVVRPYEPNPSAWTSTYANHDASGFYTSHNGQLLEMSASPLFGLRQSEDFNTSFGIAASSNDNKLPAFVAPPPNVVTEQARMDTGSRQMTAPYGTDLATQNPAQFAATLELGKQVQTLIEPDRLGQAKTMDQRLEQIKAAMFSPLGGAEYKPGQDVYLDILAQVRRNADLASGKPVPPLPTPPTAEQTQAQQSRPLIAPPTPEKQAEAEKARITALRRARGLNDESPPPPDQQQPAQNGPTQEKKTPDLDNMDLPPQLAALVDSLKTHGPSVATLANDRQDRVNDLLRRAEANIAQDHYLDAENQYRRVLDYAPGHPLATVGLIHAQLGAGLIRSAALNLRLLFAQHPELIGVRYQAHLLPTAHRIGWVRTQLQEMIDLSQKEEPALLAAYLGYQYENPTLLRYGLDLAQARDPKDPLLPILRRVWLDTAAPLKK